MDYKVEHFNKFSDDRGNLIVFLRLSDLAKSHEQFGQIYFVTFKKKGVVRGNHYHKKIREWFGVVNGKVQVVMKDVNTGERQSIILDASDERYIRLEIGPNIAHAFKSLTSQASLLNYTNKEWESDDVFYKEVIKV